MEKTTKCVKIFVFVLIIFSSIENLIIYIWIFRVRWDRAFTTQQWLYTCVLVTCMTVAGVAAWVVIQIFESPIVRVLTAGVSLLIVYVCVKWVIRNQQILLKRFAETVNKLYFYHLQIPRHEHCDGVSAGQSFRNQHRERVRSTTGHHQQISDCRNEHEISITNAVKCALGVRISGAVLEVDSQRSWFCVAKKVYTWIHKFVLNTFSFRYTYLLWLGACLMRICRISW